jgi:formylmethanofuran dehydrogenase subunit E
MQKIKTSFKRLCKRCDEMFIAETKHSILCDNCFYERKRYGIMKSKKARKI